MKNRGIVRVFSALLVFAIAIGADAPLRVTGQLLDYEKGFVFFTTGDGFRVAPDVRIVAYASGTKADRVPAPRDWARATFDASGTVTELELSRRKLPPEGSFADVRRFAVALSPTVPNPDLAPHPVATGGVIDTYSGRPVSVTFLVQVPPTTPLTADVYISTAQSGWNPRAIRMDRIDALHFRITRRINSGTVLQYLYTRGSLSTQELGKDGIQQKPYVTVIPDATTKSFNDVVYAWADQGTTNQIPQPEAIPTPFNPMPFPNLPPRPPH